MLLICFQGIVLAGLEGNSRFDDLKSGKLPVTIYAKQLEHRRAENLFIGEGFVDIRYGNVRLQADKVEFNTETGQVVAVGNVILDEGANRITGDRMEININTKLGLIYNGAGSLESGYFFTGKKIDRVAEDDFLIEEGTYTSCNQPLPDWRFKAEKTRLHIEHYAYLHNFTMRLRDIPILYAPYGVFPIKTKRSSGFLTPKIGQSNRNGFMFKNQYFWAINDWSDATFGVDYYSTRGIGESLEGRYALTDKSKGQVNAYHINDEIMAKERWQAKIGLKQELPHEVFGVFWLDASSDNQFDRQLANDIVTRSRQEQESYFSFSKNWDGYNLNFWGNYFKSLYQTNKAVYQRMPELQFNSVSQRMGTSPVFYEWESSVSELAKDSNQGDGFHMQRANLHPRLSLPWKLHDGMVLTPSAGVWNTWYSESKNGDALTRNMYDLKLQFDGPQAYRVFNVEEGEDLQALKHVVYPNITYSYIPYKDQKDVFQFDNLDQVNQAYKLDYSIINHLLGKYKSVDGREPQVRDLLTVSLSQSFNLAEERRMVNLDKSPRRPFSDFKLDVEVKPTPALRFDTETYVNVYDDYLDRVNTDVWIDPPGKIWALTSGWRYARKTPARPNGNEFLRLGGKLKLGSWRFDTSMYYNLQDEGRIEMRYRLEYFSQCWSVALIHISRPYEDEFNFTFGLMGLGSTSSN